MAHTPGPWFVGYSPEYDIDTGDDGQTIGHLTGKDEFDGTVFSVRMLENGEEELVYIAENIRKEETANLIAAAPELLQWRRRSRRWRAEHTDCSIPLADTQGKQAGGVLKQWVQSDARTARDRRSQAGARDVIA
jgi:hypothetical protein